MSPSAAYQFTGRGIIFTENQSYNCPAPLYFDTGNIRDVLIANNAFFGCRWAGLLSYPGSASFFAINVRQAGASLDGKYVDIPVKPSGGSDRYRVRLWFSYNGSTTNQPPAPATGHRLAVNYSSSDTTTVEGNARDALANDTTQGGLFSSGSLGFGCALSSPKPGVGAWAGTAVPTVSNPSYLYAQRGYEFQNWVVNSNLFEIVMADWDGQQWVPYFTAQQYGVYLQGNGADSCKDFVVSNNQVFFNPPNYVNQNQVIGYQTWGLAGHLSITDNHVDYVAGYRGGADIQVLSGATRHVFGNRTTGPTPGMPIPGLEDLSAPPFRVYDLFTDGSNYRLGRCSWVLGDFQIETVAAGTGITGLGNLVLKTAATKQIRLYGGASGANIWNFDASGSFVPGASNTYDVGSSSNMVRNLYVSIVSPGNNVFDLDLKTAAGKQMRFFGGSSGAQIWSFDSGGHLVAGTGSEMIKWGTTPGSNYPALKRSGVELHVRRADDSGGAPLVYPLAISAKTTSYTITAAEGNRCFTNAGAAAGVTFTLPDASPANVGFHCRFLIEAAQTLTVQANGSNFIRIGTALSGSHGSAATSTIGNTLHLICTQSGIWVALGHDGNWTVT